MIVFMRMLLECTVTMTVITGMVLVAVPFLRTRYYPNAIYCILMIIMVGFLIPFRPQISSPLVTADVLKVQAAPVTSSIEIGKTSGDVVTQTASLTTQYFEKSEQGTLADISDQTEQKTFQIDIAQIIFLIWAFGAVLTLIYHLLQHARFIRMVKRWSHNAQNESYIYTLNAIKEKMNIKANITIRMCEVINSPMLMGLKKPVILLPNDNRMRKTEIALVLKHELIHYKRRDIWIKTLMMLSMALHWFNPVVRLMNKAISFFCEVSCDAEVIKDASVDIRRYYSETIISVVRRQMAVQTLFATNYRGGEKMMRRRILSIMDTRKKKLGGLLACLVLAATLGTGAAFALDTGLIQERPAVTNASVDAILPNKATEENLQAFIAEVTKAESERGVLRTWTQEDKLWFFQRMQDHGLYTPKEKSDALLKDGSYPDEALRLAIEAVHGPAATWPIEIAAWCDEIFVQCGIINEAIAIMPSSNDISQEDALRISMEHLSRQFGISMQALASYSVHASFTNDPSDSTLPNSPHWTFIFTSQNGYNEEYQCEVESDGRVLSSNYYKTASISINAQYDELIKMKGTFRYWSVEEKAKFAQVWYPKIEEAINNDPDSVRPLLKNLYKNEKFGIPAKDCLTQTEAYEIANKIIADQTDISQNQLDVYKPSFSYLVNEPTSPIWRIVYNPINPNTLNSPAGYVLQLDATTGMMIDIVEITNDTLASSCM